MQIKLRGTWFYRCPREPPDIRLIQKSYPKHALLLLPYSIRSIKYLAVMTSIVADFQGLLEFMPGKENAAFDRSQRDVEIFGYFVVFVSLTEKKEGNARPLVQIVDSSLDFLQGNRSLPQVARQLGAGIDQEIIGRGVVQGLAAAALPVVVNESVPHDGHQPGPEVGMRLIVILVFKGFIRCFLNQIARGIFILGQVKGKIEQNLLLAAKKSGEFHGGHSSIFIKVIK